MSATNPPSSAHFRFFIFEIAFLSSGIVRQATALVQKELEKREWAAEVAKQRAALEKKRSRRCIYSVALRLTPALGHVAPPAALS